MAVNISPLPKFQFNQNGIPAAGAKLFTYAAGTTTKLATYTDSTGGVPNSNPILLDANGQCDMWLTAGSKYKLVLAPSTDTDPPTNSYWTEDQIPGVNDVFTTLAASNGASLIGGGGQVVSSISALRSLLKTSVSTKAFVTGYYLDGDGGGGAYYYDASDTTSADNGGTIIVASDGGRWKLETNSIISIKQFGAKGDGVTSNNAIFTVLEGLSIGEYYVPDGAYICTLSSLSKTYRGPGTIKLNGKNQYNSQDFIFQSGDSPRSVIQYKSATQVTVRNSQFVMSGFRFFGRYRKTIAPMFSTASYSNDVGTGSNLGGGMTSVTTENWYGVFACANDGDSSPTFVLMPFLRAGSVAGSVVTLNKAGEQVNSVIAQSYAWPTNSLAGVECLVITETLNGITNAFSGRVTTITANTTTTVTLSSIGTVATLDYFLPAPSGFTYYRYLGSFYYDTGAVRNIADTGTTVKAKMVGITTTTTTGSIPSPIRVQVQGFISPLATAIILDQNTTLSTASTGDSAEFFATDGSAHTIQSTYYIKNSTGNETYVKDGITLPFSFAQEYYFSTSGSLAAQRNASTPQVTGWIEP